MKDAKKAKQSLTKEDSRGIHWPNSGIVATSPITLWQRPLLHCVPYYTVATSPIKQLNYEVSGMKYKVILQQSTEGFAVSVPGLPGCHSQGATEQEALENIGAAIAEYLDVVAELAHGKTVREVEVGVA